MNKIKVKKFKTYFIERREALLQAQAQLSQIEIDAGGDEVDQIQGNILKSTLERLSLRDQTSLVRINQALKKIEEGTFGLCEECEEEIAEKRLQAIPEALLCISCAEIQEIKHR